MKNKRKFVLKILFILVLFGSVGYAQQDDFPIYHKAKKLLQRREYKKAQESFELLNKKYPNSRLIDDAAFWSAYILEKQGKNSDAFKAFDNLKKKYPKSPWIDDAEAQQINIAERLFKKGNKKYKNFIINKLDSPDKKTKYRAAVSLGKLRDQRALPVLRQMESNGDKDMGLVAKSLLRNIEKKPIKRSPGLRVLPDNQKQKNDEKSNRRTIRQPQSRTSETLPGYQKQRRTSKTPSPKINRPSRQPQTKSRTPEVKTKPSVRPTQPAKSSPVKKK